MVLVVSVASLLKSFKFKSSFLLKFFKVDTVL